MENQTAPSPRPKSLELALVDIEQGRLWMARDRLGSYLKSNPLHQAVRDVYGEVLSNGGLAYGREGLVSDRS